MFAVPARRVPRPLLVKDTLARLLRDNRALGLTTTAIADLVKSADLDAYRPGQVLFTAADESDVLSFQVVGATRVTYQGHGDRAVTVLFVKPGHFIATGWLVQGRPRHRAFGAEAHVDSWVAKWSAGIIKEVIATLPAGAQFDVMAYAWRSYSRFLEDKCLILTMTIPQRLRHVLDVLARDFGSPDARGVVIDLPLTAEDLAQLVVASEKRVSRCLATLQRAGYIERVDGRRWRHCALPRRPAAAG
ncbi:MAG TPA: Crp/Fnr family transcriptional regulator [Candidatus Binatia bacterium]|nr:Crp/Fnr family transcriptional regulator [Candidatus Binatia bacterium]